MPRVFWITMLSLFFLGACSVPSVLMQPSLPDKDSLDMAEDDLPNPSEIESEGRVTVIVDIDDQGGGLAKKAQLTVLFRSKLVGDLNEVGVDDVNREADKRLVEEIKLAEVNGRKYDGPVVADYAVLATIMESSFDVAYEKPFKIPFTDEAEYKKKKGTCGYAVTVHVGVKIKDLSASVRTVKSINVKETKKGSLETTNQNCPVPETEQRALARSAAKEVAACLTLPLQKFLSPRGHVIDTRRDEKGRTFFRISTGTSGGIKIGDAIKIYRITIQDEAKRLGALLAEGEIHKDIGPSYSWVIVNDEAKALEVKKGDMARVSHESKFAQLRDWEKCRSIRKES